MVHTPTRSKIEGWRFDHLQSAAAVWMAQTILTEQVYGRALQLVGNAPWTGQAADHAEANVSESLVALRGKLELLRQAQDVARRGAESIAGAKRDALAAIANAERQWFAVSEDLKVTDRMPAILGPIFALTRRLTAAHLQADIRAKALQLATADEDVARQLNSCADSLRDFDLEDGRGGPSPGGEPRVTGPAGPLTYEQSDADLNVTLPGSETTISGDGRTGYPTLNGEKNPLEVPGNGNGDNVRPLPTGTIVGPDGKQYAMYSEVPYQLPDGRPNPEYATADTTVVDLDDPSKSIGVLPSISQASGVYDPATNRMVIVGNTGPHPGDRTRMLYMSDPIDPKNPNGWMKTVKPVGEIKGLPGDRENQLVALKGGGFMLVGSDNATGAGSQPVSAVTASTPEGLVTAQAAPLFPGGPATWPAGAAPYGPTVVDTVYDPVTGVETVQLRISTWERPPNWVPTPGNPAMPYNPKTYTTSVNVQH